MKTPEAAQQRRSRHRRATFDLFNKATSNINLMEKTVFGKNYSRAPQFHAKFYLIYKVFFPRSF
ncbi:hypothetical protein SRABI13_04539 [Erwinia aphidicola]|nr:hypothetical protein SRABI13_04539 [Erwinia aphidicola]